MKKILFISTIILCTLRLNAQSIPAYTARDIMARCSSADTLYIINFWATWCVPCVQELPEFNALQRRYAGKRVKTLLVSLDFKEDYPQKLAHFVEKKNLMPQVAWLKDTDPNVFIPEIENSWQGSIPATLIMYPRREFKRFIEGSVSEKQISTIVNKVMSADN